MELTMKNGFCEMLQDEIMNTDGGVIVSAPYIILGGGVVAFCVGLYNGYCSATK